MRRALLTVTPATALSVGNSTDSIAGTNTIFAGWDNYNPAPATGNLTKATIVSNTAYTTDYAIFTINSADVVTAITATITTNIAAGSNTITLPAPLAVNAGDFIGIWMAGGSSGSLSFSSSSAGFTRRSVDFSFAKPTAGSTLTASVSSGSSHWLLSATA